MRRDEITALVSELFRLLEAKDVQHPQGLELR